MASDEILLGYSSTHLNRYDVKFLFPIQRKYEIEKIHCHVYIRVAFVLSKTLTSFVK